MKNLFQKTIMAVSLLAIAPGVNAMGNPAFGDLNRFAYVRIPCAQWDTVRQACDDMVKRLAAHEKVCATHMTEMASLKKKIAGYKYVNDFSSTELLGILAQRAQDAITAPLKSLYANHPDATVIVGTAVVALGAVWAWKKVFGSPKKEVSAVEL